MASMVLALQQAARDPSYPVSRLLRDAATLAFKVRISGMDDFFDGERNGYEGKELPDYSWLSGTPVAQTTFGRWVPLTLVGFDQEGFYKRPLVHSVSEIEEMIARAGGTTLVMPYPNKIVEMFRPQDPDLGSAGIQVGIHQFKGVLEHVRDMILNFALSLEKKGRDVNEETIEIIKRDDLNISKSEVKEATTVINIENLQGIAGTVASSSVRFGDFSSILNVLKNANVPQSERNELENIVDEATTLPSDERKGLASRATAWLDRNKSFLLTAGTEVTKLLQRASRSLSHTDGHCSRSYAR